MISTEYDEELALSLAREEGQIEGRREGRREGQIEGKLEIIKKMLANKLPIETIAELSDWSEEDILKIH